MKPGYNYKREKEKADKFVAELTGRKRELAPLAGSAWIRCVDRLPPEGVEVMTKIDDCNGCRNEQSLKLSQWRWWFPDMSMYVYYAPTHWRSMPNPEISDA